jgi:hypothetical protein
MTTTIDILDLQSPFGEYFTQEVMLLLEQVEKRDFEQVDSWFEQRPDFFQMDTGVNTLMYLIGKHPRYINYVINGNIPTDEKKAIVKSRHLALFKHFPIAQQLEYFIDHVHNELWSIDEDYFQVLNYQPSDYVKLQAVLANSSFGQVMGEFFANHQFHLLDMIEAKLHLDVLTCEYGGMSVAFRDNEQSEDGQIFCFDEAVFPYTIRQTIMIDYRAEKVQWLEEKGISMPDEKEAQYFKDVLRSNMNSLDNPSSHAQNFYLRAIQAVGDYQKRLHYVRLSGELDNQALSEVQNSQESLTQRSMKI